MSEHVESLQREQLIAALQVTCAYACEWADDATLFALLATLAQHAVTVAQRLDGQRYMGSPPSDMSQVPMAAPSFTGAVSHANSLG
jgi:hypothetical protein